MSQPSIELLADTIASDWCQNTLGGPVINNTSFETEQFSNTVIEIITQSVWITTK